MQRTVLRDNQYCIVLNPVDADGQPRLGQREVRRGVCSFFLHPGEVIEGGTIVVTGPAAARFTVSSGPTLGVIVVASGAVAAMSAGARSNTLVPRPGAELSPTPSNTETLLIEPSIGATGTSTKASPTSSTIWS